MKDWKKFFGYSMTFAFIGLIPAALLAPVWRDGSPVVNREIVNATIKSLSSSPFKPNGLAPGTRYMYMIELDDGGGPLLCGIQPTVRIVSAQPLQ